jgi:hypothetical protein
LIVLTRTVGGVSARFSSSPWSPAERSASAWWTWRAAVSIMPVSLSSGSSFARSPPADKTASTSPVSSALRAAAGDSRRTFSSASKPFALWRAAAPIGAERASVTAIVNFDGPPAPSSGGITATSTMITVVTPIEIRNDFSRSRCVTSRRATSATAWRPRSPLTPPPPCGRARSTSAARLRSA